MDAKNATPVRSNAGATAGPADPVPTDDPRLPADAPAEARALPEFLSTQLCRGFQRHDERDRAGAVDAFAAVDEFQFQHVSAATARAAAEAYVDALWAKDDVEDACRDAEGQIDSEELADADWSAVESAFAERAELVGMDPRYAEAMTTGWRRHKVGGDYWTAHMEAQCYELRAAVQEPAYPDKPRHGQSGYGPEATRYLLGVELHDTRQWRQAQAVMVPYFERIAAAHGVTGDES